MKEAEANKLKLTPQFLQLKFIESTVADKKLSFGEKVFAFSLVRICMCVRKQGQNQDSYLGGRGKA